MTTIVMPQDALGQKMLDTVSHDQRYVAVPLDLLLNVEGAAYPPWLLQHFWCAVIANTGGWHRDTWNRVDLLCTLPPHHQGGHGWQGLPGFPVEGGPRPNHYERPCIEADVYLARTAA